MCSLITQQFDNWETIGCFLSAAAAKHPKFSGAQPPVSAISTVLSIAFLSGTESIFTLPS